MDSIHHIIDAIVSKISTLDNHQTQMVNVSHPDSKLDSDSTVLSIPKLDLDSTGRGFLKVEVLEQAKQNLQEKVNEDFGDLITDLSMEDLEEMIEEYNKKFKIVQKRK